MKLTKGILNAGSACGDKTILTVVAPGSVKMTPGEEVSVIGFEGFDAARLKSLHDYLVDRPSLMDEKEVKQGVWALRTILSIPTPLSEL